MSQTQLYAAKNLVVGSQQHKAGSECCSVPGDVNQWAKKVLNNDKHEKAELAAGFNETSLAKAIKIGHLVTSKPEVEKAEASDPNQEAIDEHQAEERNTPREGDETEAPKKKKSKKKSKAS